jgi:hypothetical protein
MFAMLTCHNVRAPSRSPTRSTTRPGAEPELITASGLARGTTQAT